MYYSYIINNYFKFSGIISLIVDWNTVINIKLTIEPTIANKTNASNPLHILHAVYIK